MEHERRWERNGKIYNCMFRKLFSLVFQWKCLFYWKDLKNEKLKEKQRFCSVHPIAKRIKDESCCCMYTACDAHHQHSRCNAHLHHLQRRTVSKIAKSDVESGTEAASHFHFFCFFLFFVNRNLHNRRMRLCFINEQIHRHTQTFPFKTFRRQFCF